MTRTGASSSPSSVGALDTALEGRSASMPRSRTRSRPSRKGSATTAHAISTQTARHQHAISTQSACNGGPRERAVQRNQHAISMQWRPPKKGSPAHLASHSQHRAPPWRRRRHRRSPPPYERVGCHRPRACEVWQGARLPARSRAWRRLAGRAADRIPGDPSMSAPMRSLGLCVSRRPCGLLHTPPDEDGHQRSSVIIRGLQRSSVVFRTRHLG